MFAVRNKRCIRPEPRYIRLMGAQPEAIASPPALRARSLTAAGWLAPWVSLAALAFWTSATTPWALALAFVGLVLGLWRPRARGWWSLAGVGVLVAALLT